MSLLYHVMYAVCSPAVQVHYMATICHVLETSFVKCTLASPLPPVRIAANHYLILKVCGIY